MSIQNPPRDVMDATALGEVHPTSSSTTAAARSVPKRAGKTADVVIVGIDGSRCARDAAQWAATEAIRRNAVSR